MKAITLTQPWATLVALSAKRIETRSWATSYRGQVAIHAAKGMPAWAEMICYDEPFFDVLTEHVSPDLLRQPATRWFPRGAVIATADLLDCVEIRQTHDPVALLAYNSVATEHEREFGDYSIGRWLWLLGNVHILPIPIPMRGALGLWEWEQEAVPA